MKTRGLYSSSTSTLLRVFFWPSATRCGSWKGMLKNDDIATVLRVFINSRRSCVRFGVESVEGSRLDQSDE